MLIANETEITYDTHMKRYRLVAANGVELGHYRKRRQAKEAQLTLEAPEALELARRAADRHPVLAGRALRAPMASIVDTIGPSSWRPARCTWTPPATG